jgi:hypothetical protein
MIAIGDKLANFYPSYSKRRRPVEGYRNGISQRYIDQRDEARAECDKMVNALRSTQDTVREILALELTDEVADRLSSLSLYVSQFLPKEGASRG